MSDPKIVVVGASAGGVEALKNLVGGIPQDFRAAILVVLHLSPRASSALPQILARSSHIPVQQATDGEDVEPGQVYVAPPDAHLLVQDHHLVLSGGPRENGFRPSVDPLFRSAAHAYGPDAIGIILSGTGADGTEGLLAIKKHGGTTIVQDPRDALFPTMPENALEVVNVDYSLPVSEMSALLSGLCAAVPPTSHPHPAQATPGNSHPHNPGPTEPGDIAPGMDPVPGATRPESPDQNLTAFVCPECGGPLWESTLKDRVRYRCLVGHVFTPDDLLEQKTDSIERALWSAVRALEERVDLTRRLAKRMQRTHALLSAERFEEQRKQSEEAARVIRELLVSGMVSNRLAEPDDRDVREVRDRGA